MKSKVLACLALAATLPVMVLSGASVWEGAGAVAPKGELPEAGYYTATNSVPRNTVVDITNLENGKTIRVTVSSGLETPGLLAVISKDAAAVIGLRGRSIGRIRMTQPSDPIAFSHFTEGVNGGGSPAGSAAPLDLPDDAASAAAAGAATGAANGAANGAATGTGAGVPAAAASNAPAPSPVARVPAAAPVNTAASTAAGSVPERPRPLQTGTTGSAVPASAAAGSAQARQRPLQAETTGNVVPAYALEPEWEEDLHQGIADIPEVLSPPVPVSAVTRQAAPVNPAPVAEPQWRSPAAAESTGVPGGVYLPAEQTAQAADSDAQYHLAPSEERPPEASSRHVLSPEDFVPPPESAPAAGGKPLYNENHTGTPSPSASPPPESSYSPAPETKTSAAPAPAAEFSPFAVPMINRMERGKNYVQLGAYSKPEVVEDEIVRIGISYPLAIQNIGTDEKPLFRILLGPLSPGESGALLQRFRSIGYKDAFVRKN